MIYMHTCKGFSTVLLPVKTWELLACKKNKAITTICLYICNLIKLLWTYLNIINNAGLTFNEVSTAFSTGEAGNSWEEIFRNSFLSHKNEQLRKKNIHIYIYRSRRERYITGFFKVMSNRLDLRFFLSFEAWSLRKYFWAWLATWVGVLVVTKFFDIPLQSPLPSFFNPARKILCSSSVHGFPEH